MSSPHDASFYCITQADLPENKRPTYVYVSIAFALLGFTGSLWQLMTWRKAVRQTESRNSDRKRISVSTVIPVCLAAANTLYCFGIVTRALGILLTNPPYKVSTDRNVTGQVYAANITQGTVVIGTFVEVLTNFNFAASVMWTLAYAVDVYCKLRGGWVPSHVKYHIACWGLPVLTTTGSTLAVFIGNNYPICADYKRLRFRYFFSFILVNIVLVANPIICWRAHKQAKKFPVRRGTFTQADRDMLWSLKLKFIIMVAVFTICWFPNLVDNFLQLRFKRIEDPDAFKVIFPFWIIEAILNPLQGLFNCILYHPGLFSQWAKRKAALENQGHSDSVEKNETQSLLRAERPRVQRMGRVPATSK